jgi:hypothetical protein
MRRMRVLSQCSTGLGRRTRRKVAGRVGKHSLVVLTYDEAAEIAGVARRTIERLIAVSKGPAVVELSPRRRGILESDLITWLHKRRRTAPIEAPASALPLLNRFVDGQCPSRVPGSSRAPGEKSALVTVMETETMDMSEFLKGYVKAEELEPGFSVTARITAVDSREFEDGMKSTLFLDVFNGRGVVLNQTNLKTLMAAFGRKSENWGGQDVVVNRTLADFKGKPVPAIRLEAVRRAAVTAVAVATTPKLAAARAGTTTFTTGTATPDAVLGPESPIESGPPSAPPPTSYDGPDDGPNDDIDF